MPAEMNNNGHIIRVSLNPVPNGVAWRVGYYFFMT